MIIRLYACDACGERAEGVGRLPEGWGVVCWVAGLLTPPGPSQPLPPDKHYCAVCAPARMGQRTPASSTGAHPARRTS